MKSIIKYLVLVTLFIGCKCNSNKSAISKLEDFNEKLEELAPDTTMKWDTARINAEYYDLKISAITVEEINEISQENAFKELLNTERDLLSKWEQIPNFKNYPNENTDTLLKLIRGCSAFDRAPLNAERIPAGRGVRTFSLDYYEVEVPVAFHIIKNRRGDGLQGNMATRINDQITALNNTYSKFRIKFRHVSTDTTTNDKWFDRASYYTDKEALKEMTSALSKNPESVMNVYILGSQQVLGEATYPWYEERGTSMDYIVVNYNTLPGGPDTYFQGKYKEGKTLVHEVGHYLGLFHTFEGGNVQCNTAPPHDGCNIGDQVNDTPSQQVCYYEGCNENSDSCPAPGKDPVKNYMGYNPDACMTELTQGQADRLLQCIIKFRYHLLTNPI